MKPRAAQQREEQLSLMEVPMERFLNKKHALYQLAGKMSWEFFETEFGKHYDSVMGRPGHSTRLMVGLTFLKYAYDVSDERAVEEFLENPYWQYFCGFEYFQHEFPIDPSSMTRWRKRIGEEGAEKFVSESLRIAKEMNLLRTRDLKQVIVDTTVQEKDIAHPTDAKLCFKAREKLVKLAQKEGIELRQSYARKGKKILHQQARYAHAKQFKRAQRATKSLKTQLGRVIRDIERKSATPSPWMNNLLETAKRIYAQKRDSKNKKYSVHAPEVECIAKGKARKPYEFGNKVGVVTTCKGNWVLSSKAFHGNPYDGATLKKSLENAEKITGIRVRESYVDRGYRGASHHPEGIAVYLSGQKRIPGFAKKLLRKRSAIEPVIGHMKSDHRMKVNHLGGVVGDQMNATLSGAAFNLRKLLRSLEAELRRALFWLFTQLEFYAAPALRPI